MRSFAIAIVVLAAAAALSPARAGEFNYPQSGPLTSTYYSQRSYGYHGALDIAGPNRSRIVAGRTGTVSFSGWNGGYGNLVILDHEAGYQTYYAHLSERHVTVGQRVSAGQTIGLEGSTGNSTGPHVHFEVRRYGTKQYVSGSYGDRVAQNAPLPYRYPDLGGGGGGGSGQSGGGGLTAQRVTASVLNVRTGPGTGFAILGTVQAGQVYASGRSSGGWHEIWFDGRAGWSSGAYLARASGIEGREVTVAALNVRTGPGTGYAIVKTAGAPQVYLRAGGASGEWVEIWFGGARRWFHGAYTRPRAF